MQNIDNNLSQNFIRTPIRVFMHRTQIVRNLQSTIIGTLAKPKNRFFRLFGYTERARWKILLIALVFAACSSKPTNDQVAMFSPPANHKLKQKTAVLQKKLENAEHSLLEDQSAIERLRSELCHAELNVIEIQIENFEQKWQIDPQKMMQWTHNDSTTLFHEEREILNRIIRNGPDVARAQGLLDRILKLITQVSDYADR